MRRCLFLAVVLPTLAAACATPEADQQVAMSDSTRVCSREMPTGSKIPVMRCRSTADIEAQRLADKETAERIPTEKHDVLLGR
jgi:hypothetical protein